MRMDIINILALIFTTISLAIAIIQTTKLKNLRKVRDSNLQLIWLKAKELSHTLYEKEKTDSFRRECFVRAQRLEEIIALLIVNLGKFNERKINDLKNKGIIDDYDVKLLSKLTKPLR